MYIYAVITHKQKAACLPLCHSGRETRAGTPEQGAESYTDVVSLKTPGGSQIASILTCEKL